MNLTQLSRQDTIILSLPFSPTEIKQAMFQMEGSKSPALDGMSNKFFKKHWEIVGVSVIEGIQSFFRSGYFLKEWNH